MKEWQILLIFFLVFLADYFVSVKSGRFHGGLVERFDLDLCQADIAPFFLFLRERRKHLIACH